MGEKVLKIIPHADLKNLDPIWTTAYITRNHGYMIYDTLIGLDSDLKPQPQMLDKWDVSNDGLTYTFTLRNGLQWHDGKPEDQRIVLQALIVGENVRGWGKS